MGRRARGRTEASRPRAGVASEMLGGDRVSASCGVEVEPPAREREEGRPQVGPSQLSRARSVSPGVSVTVQSRAIACARVLILVRLSILWDGLILSLDSGRRCVYTG